MVIIRATSGSESSPALREEQEGERDESFGGVRFLAAACRFTGFLRRCLLVPMVVCTAQCLILFKGALSLDAAMNGLALLFMLEGVPNLACLACVSRIPLLSMQSYAPIQTSVLVSFASLVLLLHLSHHGCLQDAWAKGAKLGCGPGGERGTSSDRKK